MVVMHCSGKILLNFETFCLTGTTAHLKVLLVSWVAACLRPRPEMEPWPVLAWVLLLALVADWVKSVQSRDFTVKDIVFLHPSSKN